MGYPTIRYVHKVQLHWRNKIFLMTHAVTALTITPYTISTWCPVEEHAGAWLAGALPAGIQTAGAKRASISSWGGSPTSFLTQSTCYLCVRQPFL